MKKLLLLVVCLMLGEISLLAQHRSESEAIQIAQEFFGKGEKKKAMKLSVVSQQNVEMQIRKKIAPAKRASSTTSSFYVVNDDANNRFVIVSADERMYQILGYSDNGTFDSENMPVALYEIFDGYDRQYDLLLDYAESIEMTNPRRVTTPAIEPLIKTKWGQDSPYNDDCPINKRVTDGSNCASGCVATAMAQVMNYHQYPSTGIGSYSYTSATQKHYQAMDFGNTTFNWNNLKDTYNNDDATEDQKAEVAKLMHACGIAVSMDYGSSSDGQSSACPYDIAYAMINYFGYNPNMVFKMKDYYSVDEWEAIIIQELEAGRPMLYGGRGSGGHRFILDGCDTDGLYHFNFGWTFSGYSLLDGYGNGYYSLDAIRPQDLYLNILAGKEVDLGNFSNEQSMVCQISPTETGIHEDVFYTSSFNMSASLPVKIGNSVNCWFSATNYSSSTSSTDNKSEKFKGEIGIGLYDTNWNFIKSLYSENFSKHSYKSAWVDHDVILDASTFNSNNQFFIAPYAKASSSTMPTRIRTTYGKGWYLAEVDGGNIVLTKNGEPEPIPEIPTGTIYASALGAGDKQVSDTNEKPTIWQLTLTKDPNEPAMYWFDNFDPAVTGNSNRVYGFIDKAGSQISIPIGQKVGENLSITTYSNSGDIIVNVSSTDSTMIITDAWGTIETSSSGDNTTSKQLSFYSTTNFSFKSFEHDSVIIGKPLITVSDTKMMSITSSTSDAEIYYTLNGTEPSESSTKYSSQQQLTGNCIIKAIAIKDGVSSEIAIYEETGFVVSKPTITQPTESDIEISCSTLGATIYYTKDGTNPTEKSTKYEGKFTLDESCVIKAIGIKQNYTNSEIATFAYSKPGGELVINNNIAGNLPSRLSEGEKMSTKGLIVSGNLNGTDIAFIREMIINGKLTDLNIENSNIVSGGDPYYVPTYGTPEYTTDNIIGKYMFYNCKGLISIKLPISATEIKMFSFWNCTNLKTLNLPASCNSVESSSIYNCSNLEMINLSANVRSFDSDNTSNCKSLKAFTVDSQNVTYREDGGILYTIDGTLVKYPMAIEYETFNIPINTKTIGVKAFEYAKFKSVTIPPSVTVIEAQAFVNCKSIETIDIPNSVNELGHMAFWGCSNLVSVNLSTEISKIKTATFDYCISLRDFTIGKKIYANDIADDAFDHCTSLQAFYVDANNTSLISDNGILYTKDMKSLKRCPLAFYIDELYIPDGVESISAHAFEGCTNICKIRLPESVVSIGSSAFIKSSITSINLPDSINNIGYMAFWGCKGMESIALPEKLEKISNSLFYDCEGLNYLYIPSNVKSFESDALKGCKNLTMIESKISEIEQVEVDFSNYQEVYTSFRNIPDTCTWRVPYGTSQKYKSLPWWVSTWRIIEDNPIVSYNVFIGASGFATFSAWNSAFLPDGLKAFVVTKVDGTIATLTEVPNLGKGIGYVLKGAPNTSYIITLGADEAEIDYSYANSNLMLAAPDGADIGQDGMDYILADDGNGEAKFFLSEPGRIGNNKAYLRYTGNAASLSLRIDEGTGITETLDVETPKVYYDLQGRPVIHPIRGLFIVNGKKEIVK